MKTKHISVKNFRATYNKDDGNIVCGNVYDLVFDFDEAWNGYDVKKAKIKFHHNGRYEHLIIEFKGNVCTIPKLYNIPRIEVGVFVEDGIGTTTGAIIECEKSINCGASKSVLGADAIDNLNKALAGKDGKDGRDGKDGEDGHTPQKGIDYYTEADKSEMIQAVLSALPDNREVAY